VDEHPVTPAQTHELDAEPSMPEYWVDEKGNLHPKPHKVKGRWQETARDLMLFPLLKLIALILALIILGALTPDGIVPFNMN